MATQSAITGATPVAEPRLDLQFLRASGLAQARLQVAVLSGNRRRALEQIDRLVTLDKLLEHASQGRFDVNLHELGADLTDQRLALASEKLVLTSEISLPRLEPAFGAGFAAAIPPEEPVEIAEPDSMKRGLLGVVLWSLGLVVLCAALAGAGIMLL